MRISRSIFHAGLPILIVLFFLLQHAGTAAAATAGDDSIVILHVAAASSTPVAPSIELKGANPIDLIVGDTFVDPGVTASDTEGDDLSGSAVVTGGPVNTSIVSTTTLIYTVTDPFNGLQASTTRVVIVNPPAVVIPSNPPVSGPTTNSSGGSVMLYGFDLGANIATSTASLQWLTNIPALASLSWGTDQDALDGSVSEITASTSHAISLGHLIPETAYYVIVKEYAANGMTSSFSYAFTTKSRTAVAYPSNVDSLAAVRVATGIYVSWIDPTDTDIASILVTRGTRFFPRDPQEGYVAFDGNATGFIDTQTADATDYYYTVFVRDIHGNYSSGAAVRYVHPSLGFKPPVSPFSSSGSPFFGGTATNMSSTSLSSIIFMQKGVALEEKDGAIALERGEALTISIPPQIVPKDIEEAIIKMAGGDFIFEKLKSGWLQAVIPATFAYQDSTPFEISFLFVGSETDLQGIFTLPYPSMLAPGDDDKVMPNFFPDYFIFIIVLVLILAGLRRLSKGRK